MPGCPFATGGSGGGSKKKAKRKFCTYQWRRKDNEKVLHATHECGQPVDDNGWHQGPHKCVMCGKTP